MIKGRIAEKYVLTFIESHIVFQAVYNIKRELGGKSDIK